MGLKECNNESIHIPKIYVGQKTRSLSTQNVQRYEAKNVKILLQKGNKM